MTAEEQHDYTARYFQRWKGGLRNPGDRPLAILWPAGVGKSGDTVLFAKGGATPKP